MQMNLALSEVFKILYIASIVLSLLAVLTLYSKNTGNQYINKVVSLFILITMLPLLVGYSNLSILNLPSLVIKISHKISWLYGPSIFLLIKVSLNQVPRNQWSFSLHSLPFILFTLSILLGWYTESAWIAIATFIQLGIYTFLSSRLILIHRQQIALLFLGHKQSTYYWAALLLIGAFSLTLLEAVSIYVYLAWGGLNPLTRHLFLLVFALYLIVIALLLLFQTDPPIKEIVESSSEKSSENHQIETNTKDETSAPKRTLKELTLDSAIELSNKLDVLMQKDKPFLRNDYSLNALANSLAITTHQLSELLNIHLGYSFYEYINKARFEHAKQLLSDPSKKQTILDIAYESGFNNKNTFYKVFKQYTNKTPKAYRDSLLP